MMAPMDPSEDRDYDEDGSHEMNEDDLDDDDHLTPSRHEHPRRSSKERTILVRTKSGNGQVFASISEASRYTSISPLKIKTICHQGGGFQKNKSGRTSFYIAYNNGDPNSETSEIETPKPKRRRSAPKKLEPFDVSTLLPLTRVEKSTKKMRKIELICKLTGEVHACFSNVEYAAQALDVTPSVVRTACKSFGEVQLDEDLPFCQLRVVKTSSAYEYGAHTRGTLFLSLQIFFSVDDERLYLL